MKIDLDDIERKAKNVDGHKYCCGPRYMDVTPALLLALIARIRELEAEVTRQHDVLLEHARICTIGLERIAKAASAFVDAQGKIATRALLEHDYFATSEWEDLVLAVEGAGR